MAQARIREASTSGGVTRIRVDAVDARTSVRLASSIVNCEQAIVVADVAEGSAAWRAGLRAGDVVRGVSDPQSPTTVWPVDARSSLRYVREAVRVCNAAQLTLDVVHAAAGAAPPMPATPARGGVVAAAATPQRGAAEATASIAPPSFAASSSVLESVLGTMWEDTGEYERPHRESVATRLERVYKRQRSQHARSRARIARRREAMDDVRERDDSVFLAVAAAVFILPPAVILAWAHLSGYLDTLRSQY